MIEEQSTPSLEEFFSKKNTPITQPSPSDLMVIPDVHGDLEALDRSVHAGLDFFSQRGVVPEIIFLGDLIDRGPDSCKVIQTVMGLIRNHLNVTLLVGNHEAMFIECLYNPDPFMFSQWIYNGGLETLKSFAFLFDSKMLDLIKELQQSIYTEDFPDVYHSCLLNDGLIRDMASILKGQKLLVNFFESLDLCIQRSSDLFVHAGFVPDFIASESDLNKWIFAMQTNFKQSLLNKLNGTSNNFAHFQSASISRGGKSVAGPLWADISDFNLSSFDSALLATLCNNQSVNRMIVGHTIVSHPYDLSVSPISGRKLEVMFLDVGMSSFYNTSYSGMVMCITESGEQFILNNSNQLISYI